MILTQFQKDSIQLTAQNLGVATDWLDKAIFLESNYRPDVVNGIGATGLIQFTKTTAKGLGTTTDALRTMTFVEQMKYVEIYLKRAIKTYGIPRDFISFYCLIFHPPFVSANLNATLPPAAYVGNRFIDLNHDGTVTKQELSDSLNIRLAKKKVTDVFANVTQHIKDGTRNAFNAVKDDTDAGKPIKILVIAAGVAAILWLIRKIFRARQ